MSTALPRNSRRVARARRGFTIVELVVVMLLTSVFALILGRLFTATYRQVVDVRDRAVGQQDARQVADDFIRDAQGAASPGACADSGTRTLVPLAHCRHPVSTGTAVRWASATSVQFFAYTRPDTAAGTTAATCTDPVAAPSSTVCPPDLVTLSLTPTPYGTAVVLTVLPPAVGTDFTSADTAPVDPSTSASRPTDWQSTPVRTRVLGYLDPAAATGAHLSYFDATMTPLHLPATPTPAQLAAVSIVQLQAQAVTRLGASFPLNLFAKIAPTGGVGQ